MERRSFLRGIIGSVAAGEALVKLATPTEALELVNGADVGLVPIRKLPIHETQYPSQGTILYVENRGSFLPVGIVTEMKFHREIFDVSSYADLNAKHFVTGPMTVTGSFVCQGITSVGVTGR